MRAIARDNFLFWPPDRLSAIAFFFSRRFNLFMSSMPSASAWFLVNPFN
jgi:hypothetical protein